MAQLSDSTRRLLIFIAIIAGGSVLLIFDIPVLYLMLAVIILAFILLIITGTLILSEFIREIRIKLKNRKPKPKKQKPPKKTEPKKDKKSGGSFSIGNLLKGLKVPSLTKGDSSQKTKKEKTEAVKPEKKGKSKSKEPTDEMDELDKELSDLPEEDPELSGQSGEPIDDDLLDGLDLDGGIDIDAELESVNPEFDSVRTPFGESGALDDLPSEDQVKRMDISTKAEEDEIILDNDESSDEIEEIYSTTYDVGSDGGEDVISTMEGGDSISSSDLASYGSSDETPYNYGAESGDDSGGEEQFELTPGAKGGGFGDDDLIASLKADISDMNKKDDDVLLRDLKDIHVTAEDLEDELREIMEIITRKAKMK